MKKLFGHQASYSVLQHPVLGYKVIRTDSAGIWAFLFGPFWLLYHRMWVKGLLFFALFIAIAVVMESLQLPSGQYIPTLLLMLLFLLKGGRWKESQYVKSRGFKKLGEIKANSAEHALSLLVKEEEK